MPNLTPSVSDTTNMSDSSAPPLQIVSYVIANETTVMSDVDAVFITILYMSLSDITVMRDVMITEEEGDINLGTDNIIKNYRYISAILKLADRAARQATLFNNTTPGSRNYIIRELLADVDGTQQTNVNIATEILNIVRGDQNQDISTS